ncbi:MAG: aminopeptidase [Pseudonocardiales bacterium]|nr:aminopeptidase [Pseudonocardiales bacterium]
MPTATVITPEMSGSTGLSLGNVGAMPSLTRAEAVARASLLDIESYRISLVLTEDEPEFESVSTIRFRSGTPGTSTFLDCKASELVSVTLNGAVLEEAELRDGRLELTALQAENEITVVSRMRYSADGEGLHRHVDPADSRSYLYAMSFLDAGPRWFACFDQPDLKAPYDIEVRCPEDWIVLGNGAATRQSAGTWTLATTQPLSTYFVTLAAGPYHSVTAEHDGIPLGLHARASLAEHLDAEAPEMLEVTRRAFDRYHELFGVRYPFGSYHQVFCPDFNAGAMENPGCVTLRDQYVFRSTVTEAERGVRANTIVHEMAHMWFGDLVTMRWWDDLWLNESFAEYMSHRVCSEVTHYPAWTEFGIRRKAWGYIADQSPSTHPVAGNGSTNAAAALADFDGISYAKGAAVLKQLVAYLGDDVFFAGLRRYFADHAFANADFADLMQAWNEAGAQHLDEWAAQWLRTSGLDTLIAEPESDSAGLVLTRDATAGSRRPHAVTVAGFDWDGKEVLTEAATLAGGPAAPIRISSSKPVALALADSADDSWAKIRFGSDGWPAVRQVLPGISNPSSRVVIYNAVRDAVRDADLDPAIALDIVLHAIASESSSIVVADLLGFAATQLAAAFSPPAERPFRLQQVAEVADRLLGTATEGTDDQLTAARALIRSTSDSARLHDWLDGSKVPDGLRIDAELRWIVLNRLATLGAIDEQAIAAELDRDRSASGSAHAARARAARPDPDAKRDAWRLLTEPSDTSAYELYATAEGFFQPSQSDWTAEYVPRFFAEMPLTARHRHGWALGRVVLLGYPAASATRDTLLLAESTLGRADLESGVHRSLVDGTDSLRRAVDSLDRYGQIRT